jgi:hypothetical protein
MNLRAALSRFSSLLSREGRPLPPQPDEPDEQKMRRAGRDYEDKMRRAPDYEDKAAEGVPRL